MEVSDTADNITRRMRFSYWITEASTLRLCNTYCFPRQQWLHERASMFRYTCIVCLVTAYIQIYRATFMPLQVNAIHGRTFCRLMNPFCRYGMTSVTVNRYVSRKLHKITHTHTHTHTQNTKAPERMAIAIGIDSHLSTK